MRSTAAIITTDTLVEQFYPHLLASLKNQDSAYYQINKLLTNYRYELANKFIVQEDPVQVLWHAILTDNVNTLNLKNLLLAYSQLKHNPGLFYTGSNHLDKFIIDKLRKFILKAVELIIYYLRFNDFCQNVKQNFIDLLSDHQEDNPFYNLGGATLENLNLNKANLSYINLAYATLKHISLKKANLKHINLFHSLCQDVDLKGCSLTGAHLNWADLAGVKNYDFPRLDFTTYLLAKFPAHIRLPEPLPSANDLTILLKKCQRLFTQDKQAHLAQPFYLRYAHKTVRQHDRHLLAHNIIKLSRILDNERAVELLHVAYQDPFFANNDSSRKMAKVNTFLLSPVSIFAQAQFPLLGNYCQLLFLNELAKRQTRFTTRPRIK